MEEGRVEVGVVVFTDLVGSTALRSALGERRADRLALAHELRLRTLVEQHHGKVVKGGGDGVMAKFASASDAVSAAAHIQRDSEVTVFEGQRLSIRIGVAAGDVTVTEDDCFGRPVVEAARLEAHAEGGQILCSETVRMLAGDRSGHEFASVGSLQLHGLPEPLPSCEVEWRRHDTSEFRLPFPSQLLASKGSHELLGRSDELGTLGRALDVARGRRRTMVTVSGEAGIGKTRLTAEFCARAHEHGATVLFGGHDVTLTVPFRAMRSMIGHLERHLELDVAADVFGAAGPAIDVLRSQPTSQRPAELDVAELAVAVDQLVTRLAAASPVVAVVDDLQWAPNGTIQVLRHLMSSDEPASFLLIATLRPNETASGSAVAGLLELARRRGDPLIELDGLDEESVRSLAIGTGLQLADDDIAHLLQRTDGNALFVNEILAAGVAGQSLDDTPASVSDVVLERAAACGGIEVLHAAAVLGDRFAITDVRAMVDPLAFDTLDDAIEAGLVQFVRHGECAFGHAVVRDALLADLGPVRRGRLEAAAAEAIRARVDDHPELLPQLARHAAHAAVTGSDVDDAFDLAVRASSYAERSLAFDEAAAILETARTLIAEFLTSRQRAELMLQLAVMQGLAGTEDASIESVRMALASASVADEDIVVGAALAYAPTSALWIGSSREGAAAAEGAALVDRALDTGAGSAVQRARLELRQVAFTAVRRPIRERSAIASRAMDVIRSKGAVRERLNGLIDAKWGLQNLQEPPFWVYEELGRLAEAHPGPHADWWNFMASFTAAWYGRDIESMRSNATEWWSVSESLGPAEQLWARLSIAAAELLAGERATAWAWIESPPSPGSEGLFGTWQRNAPSFVRLLALAENSTARIEEFIARHPDTQSIAPTLDLLFEDEVGQSIEARPSARWSDIERLDRIAFPDRPTGAILASVVALEATRAGDDETTRRMLERLEPFAGVPIGTPWTPLPTGHFIAGRIAEIQGSRDEARRRFERAHEHHQQLGSPLFIEISRHALQRFE